MKNTTTKYFLRHVKSGNDIKIKTTFLGRDIDNHENIDFRLSQYGEERWLVDSYQDIIFALHNPQKWELSSNRRPCHDLEPSDYRVCKVEITTEEFNVSGSMTTQFYEHLETYIRETFEEADAEIHVERFCTIKSIQMDMVMLAKFSKWCEENEINLLQEYKLVK